MKPVVIGKNILLRDVEYSDAEFLLDLRMNPKLNKHLSETSSLLVNQQKFIEEYKKKVDEYYFIILDKKNKMLGSVRIYNLKEDSFCWGSWILSRDSPIYASIESALLIYDYAFFALHFRKSHFDVRKENLRVIDFHKRFGATIIGEDEHNLFFEYERNAYLRIRDKYSRYLI